MLVIILIISFLLNPSLTYAQELRGLEKKPDDFLATSGRVIRIGTGFDDGVKDGSKKSKIIKRSFKATTTTIKIVLGVNPLAIVASNVGIYGARRKLKKETGCSNIYKNCCLGHGEVIELKNGLTYCSDGEINVDCKCNN